MLTMKKAFFRLMLVISMSTTSNAADLMDVYLQALDNDPTFKTAFSQFQAHAQSIEEARAALLPQVTTGGEISRNLMRVNAGSNFRIREYFNRHEWHLTATQTIFNYNAWARLQEAKAAVKAEHATFYDAAQDLILRAAHAYFEVLFAKDTLNFAESKLRANKRQLHQARQRFEVGLDPITSVYEAKAAYDQSIAEVIASKNNQINQSEQLRKLTNNVYDELAPLRNSRVPLIKPEPNDVNEWVHVGLKQNYKLLSAKYNLQAARDKVKSQTAGNWPTLGIRGATNQAYNTGASTNFFIPGTEQTSQVALTVNYPFYQGGLVEAKTRQAQYEFQTSSQQLEKIFRDVSVDSKIAFNTIVDGISKVRADRQTLVSQQNSLESTEAQFQVGTRTMVDVVNAQQRLFEAQRQLARDQYNLINSILNLKYLAGSLNVDDLEEINAWLKTTRINQLPPK